MQARRAAVVRVEVNPTKLSSMGLTMANLQAVLSIQNSNCQGADHER